MIILPDKNIPCAKFLMPVPKKEWMVPSLAQPKDQFGKENRTYFTISAYTNDGVVCWNGIYEDREDFDAVLWAIATDTLKYEKSLWPLSTPSWEPWLGEIITYHFATYTIYSSPTGSNQTYNKPTDWADAGSKIECIGAGGSGGAIRNTGAAGTTSGAGAGSYSQITNFSFTGSSATYQIGTGGTAAQTGTGSAAEGVNGSDGGNTWFNDTADPGVGTNNTKCSAEGGKKGLGLYNAGLTAAGGAGGATTASWGETKWKGGGGGGSGGFDRVSAGGGGSGGSTGDGNNGVTGTSNTQQTNGGAGGAGDAGVGSAGSAGTAGAATGSNGGNGTNLADATVGTGGGGGGYQASINGSITSGSGGNYGGGGSGCVNRGSGNSNSTKATSGAGIGGLIIITYTPSVNNGKFLLMFH